MRHIGHLEALSRSPHQVDPNGGVSRKWAKGKRQVSRVGI